MYVKNYVSLEKLKERTRSEKKPKVARRIQIIMLAIQGDTAPAIARPLSLSRRSCQQWVQRFNQQGLAGLQDQSGRGRKPVLECENDQHFSLTVSETIPVDEHAVVVWDGAGFHRSKALVVPKNMTLIQLPPYTKLN